VRDDLDWEAAAGQSEQAVRRCLQQSQKDKAAPRRALAASAAQVMWSDRPPHLTCLLALLLLSVPGGVLPSAGGRAGRTSFTGAKKQTKKRQARISSGERQGSRGESQLDLGFG